MPRPASETDDLADLQHRSRRLPAVIAVATAAAGLITLVSVASFPLSGTISLLNGVVPLTLRTGAASVAALAGFGLLIVAGALARRQRVAWWIALSLLVVAGFTHMVRDLDVLNAGLTLGLAVLLVVAQREFTAKPHPGSLPRALLALPTLAVVAWSFGWIAIMTYAHGLMPHPTVGSAAVSSARALAGLDPGFTVSEGVAGRIPGLLPILGVVVLVVAVALLFRPVVEGVRRSGDDAARARTLVRDHGSDTLAYFALRDDKSYFLQGDAVIAYRYLWNLALVSGDPLGDPRDVGPAMAAFVRHSRAKAGAWRCWPAGSRWPTSTPGWDSGPSTWGMKRSSTRRPSRWPVAR